MITPIRIISMAVLLMIQLWTPQSGNAVVFLPDDIQSLTPVPSGEKTLKVLFSIYREVKEFGKYAGDDFINREFHIDLDGRRQNSEEFVVVLIHDTDEGETMILELTYFSDKKTIYSSKYLREVKRIVCTLKQETVRIVESNFSQHELEKILPLILEGIISKKKLLEVLKKNPGPFT